MEIIRFKSIFFVQTTQTLFRSPDQHPTGSVGRVGGEIRKSTIRGGWLIVKLLNSSVYFGYESGVLNWSLHGWYEQISLHLIYSLVNSMAYSLSQLCNSTRQQEWSVRFGYLGKLFALHLSPGNNAASSIIRCSPPKECTGISCITFTTLHEVCIVVLEFTIHQDITSMWPSKFVAWHLLPSWTIEKTNEKHSA